MIKAIIAGAQTATLLSLSLDNRCTNQPALTEPLVSPQAPDAVLDTRIVHIHVKQTIGIHSAVHIISVIGFVLRKYGFPNEEVDKQKPTTSRAED
jgi:hypothetical protein